MRKLVIERGVFSPLSIIPSTDGYKMKPKLQILQDIASGTAEIGLENEFDRFNLDRLIDAMFSEDACDRDWATMLLAQSCIDNQDIRNVLVQAAHDEDLSVRSEAILGIVQRDRSIGLEHVRKALADKWATLPIFEAAAILGDPSLLPLLENFNHSSEDEITDAAVRDAIVSCHRISQA